jgi:hypothetical protein
MPGGDVADFGGRSHEDGRDQPFRARLDGAFERRLIAWMGDGGWNRAQPAAPRQQLLVLSGSRFSRHQALIPSA